MRLVLYALVIFNLVYLAIVLLAPRPAAVDVRPLPAEGAPLVLLRDQPQAYRDNGEARANGRLCLVLGPWGDDDKARRALTQLRAAGLDGRVRSVPVQRERLNWVYLPPFASRDAALRVLRELQSLGVDSFIVDEGEQQYAISLGYFSSAASAEGLRLKMRNEGYAAFVRETSKTVTEYWVYLDSQWREKEAAVVSYLQGNPEVKRDRAACS